MTASQTRIGPKYIISPSNNDILPIKNECIVNTKRNMLERVLTILFFEETFLDNMYINTEMTYIIIGTEL